MAPEVARIGIGGDHEGECSLKVTWWMAKDITLMLTKDAYNIRRPYEKTQPKSGREELGKAPEVEDWFSTLEGLERWSWPSLETELTIVVVFDDEEVVSLCQVHEPLTPGNS